MGQINITQNEESQKIRSLGKSILISVIRSPALFRELIQKISGFFSPEFFTMIRIVPRSTLLMSAEFGRSEIRT